MFDIESAVEGYIEAQLWAGLLYTSEVDDNPETIDQTFSRDDVPDQYVARVHADVAGFVASNYDDAMAYCAFEHDRLLTYGDAACFGHDYYLTREGHGAGFWDRGMGEVGQRLSDAASANGEAAYPFIDEAGRLAFDNN